MSNSCASIPNGSELQRQLRYRMSCCHCQISMKSQPSGQNVRVRLHAGRLYGEGVLRTLNLS